MKLFIAPILLLLSAAAAADCDATNTVCSASNGTMCANAGRTWDIYCGFKDTGTPYKYNTQKTLFACIKSCAADTKCVAGSHEIERHLCFFLSDGTSDTSMTADTDRNSFYVVADA